ncbi:CHAT domain-containing protein [Nonomuraea sediminis]|uniref:CHAT domain-containing protein n=1 Tax=Nonomuraea sediminis TaxID=2835864 RepID=UPI001BDCABBE|nr:CHAT domain-containing protein [Nonomuraea sediminis]
MTAEKTPSNRPRQTAAGSFALPKASSPAPGSSVPAARRSSSDAHPPDAPAEISTPGFDLPGSPRIPSARTSTDEPDVGPPARSRTEASAGLVGAAEMAVVRAIIDPPKALREARAVLARAERERDVEAAVVALRGMALAARELGDLHGAERHLRRAIATQGAPAERVAQARLSLVTVRTERGHPLQALRVAALAWAYLSPLDRAKLDTQRAVALAHLGRHVEAVAACDRSLEALAAAPASIDNRRFLAGGLLNRGLVHAYRGDWDTALTDITACREISAEAGLDYLGRLAAANLPFLAVRRGDLATAFARYREAEDTLFGFPERLATMRADFAGALLAAHLPGEARAMLSLAVPDLEAAGAHVALAEARLKLAQVELLTGDARQALAVARRAARDLAGQDRDAWLPLAAEVVLRARLDLEEHTGALLDELVTCADELESESAHVAAAAALRLVAAEVALELDDHPTASAQLDRLICDDRHREAAPRDGSTPLASAAQAAHLDRPSSQVPALVRQHALALEAALQEDTASAFRAVRDGLAEVGCQVEAFEDPALRAHVARAGERLASFGLGLAIHGGLAEEVFEWAERWRAVASSSGPGVSDLCRVRQALGDAALVEYMVDGGRLLAVAITSHGIALRRLGAVDEVTDAVVQLRYAMRRTSLRDATHAASHVAAAAREVERLVLGPLRAELDGRELVVVPAGPLHTLPWAALPYLHDRPVSVTASAAGWLRARSAVTPRVAPLVLGAFGPGLEYAQAEVDHVVGGYAGGAVVPGRRADVLAGLARADVFHLAAHGVFDSRSPLLSGITLDDGPLMAYDLLRLPRTAGLVVLSSCDSGMARTPAEGAPLGLAGTFLSRGTSCVVAGMIPVRDDEALAVMTLFHELLAAGQPPAHALATASTKTTVQAFTCFGAADLPITSPS